LGISDHDRRPKEVIERERKLKEIEDERQRIEHTTKLIGKQPEIRTWQRYIKLPDRKRQIGTKQYHPILEKEEYIEPIVLLARQYKDDINFGKPIFHTYSRALRPSDVNYEMGGIKKAFRALL